jgi:hypothetical protein
MAGSRGSSPNALLAAVPKRGRDAIARIMAERGGDRTLEQLLERNWNYHDYLRSDLGLTPRDANQQIDEMTAALAREHPAWSPDQVRGTVPFLTLTIDLREVAIARRFTLDDPAELGRGLAVLGRLRWFENLLAGTAGAEFNAVLEAFAVRDLEAATRLVAGEPAVSRPADGEELEFLDLGTLAVAAAVRRDDRALGSVVRRMAGGKLPPWQQGVRACLGGLADRRADAVAAGLNQFLDGMRKLRQKDELEEAVCLTAHGLFRLCEWASPDLVAGFAVTVPIPWDAGFHAWTEAHPDPLAGLDLTGISPALHDAVVRLRPPTWWG